MKKPFLLFIACVSLAFAAYAQYPEKGAKGFTFGLSTTSGIVLNVSHNGTLQYKYYLSDDFVMRYSLALNINNTSSSSTSIGKQYDANNNYYSAGLGIGCEKILAKINRFDVYAGADLIPTIGGGTSTSTSTVVDATQAGGVNGDFTKTVTSRATIFTASLYPCLGFEYFISKNFSIGAEFNFGIAYSFPGTGKTVQTSQTNGIPGNEINTYSKENADFTINSTNAAYITGSFYF